jgi:hypothetical protein
MQSWSVPVGFPAKHEFPLIVVCIRSSYWHKPALRRLQVYPSLLFFFKPYFNTSIAPLVRAKVRQLRKRNTLSETIEFDGKKPWMQASAIVNNIQRQDHL